MNEKIIGLSNRFSRPETHFHHKSINWLSAQCVSSTAGDIPEGPTFSVILEARLQSVMSKNAFCRKMKKLRIQICRHLDFCPSDGNSSVWFGRYHPRKQQTLGEIVPYFIGTVGLGAVLIMSALIRATRKKENRSKIRQGWVWSYILGRHIL